jgi:hypothetical protein
MENGGLQRLKKSRGENDKFTVKEQRELIIFRLKLWNRSASEVFDWALRVYDSQNDLVTTFPLGINFKSRRMRGETEVFTPYKNSVQLPSYVNSIYFKVEPLRAVAGNAMSTEFEVKFDLF